MRSVLQFLTHVIGIYHIFQGSAVLGYEEANPERRLFDDLISFYDDGTRPVVKADSTITVNFSLSLQQIVDLDEKNQTLITQVWIHQEWYDEVLRWNPSHYNGIEEIVLPADRIWVPDLYIYNNAEKGFEGFIMVSECRTNVHADGHVTWMVPLMIKSSCAVDVTYFPFDNQHCSVRFGSWIYDSDQVNIVNNEVVDVSRFIPNNEYELLSITLEREVRFYEVFAGSYPQIIMALHIRRRPTFYAYTVIAPTLVLCMMTLFTFLLPCDNGDKVGIGLTVFLSLYVLQLAIAESIPDSNSLPLIGLFMTLVMTLNSVSLLFATLVINIKKKGDRIPCPEVPRFLLLFCVKFLAKITCTKLLTFFDLYDICELEENHLQHLQSKSTSTQESQASTSTAKPMHVSRKHRNSMDGLRFDNVKGMFSRNNPPRDLRLEWYFVAQVIDKTLFILFLIASMMTIFIPLVIIPAMHRND